LIDLLIIGGGINGTGIARDAAGRGLSVALVEQHDLASHTSSASTKLIHGGLRYLEQYEFRLVHEALRERERLLGIAPHIIWPLRFVLPIGQGMRPAWLLRLGLFIYDHLGGRRSLPGTQALRFDGSAGGTGLGAGLAPSVRRGFAYSDCWVQDARLVALNAVDAAARGARILTRTRLVSARPEDGAWVAQIEDAAGGQSELRARAVVNAAGPWVSAVIHGALGVNTSRRTRLVKGSHIVVNRLYEGEHAYIFQNPDRRVVFAIPYEGRFTLIGTTDSPYEDDPAQVACSDDEAAYLCGSVDRWFSRAVTRADIVWRYAGVRALFDDGAKDASEVTRDYVLDLETPAGGSKLLSVFGGKITTYRKLAEHALEKLGVAGRTWTADAPLPGGDMAGGFDAYLAAFAARHRFLPGDVARRLVRAYGTRAEEIVAGAARLEDLGEDFGAGLSAAEVRYLVRVEFARTAEDILWRRSKLGLHAPAGTAARVDDFLRSAAMAAVAE
jgi:glycerol-3-phosphate dehydrogenase